MIVPKIPMRAPRSLHRSLACSLLILIGAVAAHSQVNLETPQPASAIAGSTVEQVTGAPFPAATFSPANVSVDIATVCDQTPIVSITPISVTITPSSYGTIAFTLPTSLAAGKYSLSVHGTNPAGVSFGTTTCSSITVKAQSKFVTVTNGQFTLGGQPLHFSGADVVGLNNTTQPQTDQYLQLAASEQFQALRIWAFIDIGNQNGSNSVAGPINGIYDQYWNGSGPAYNDGPNGLGVLDYSIYQAGLKGFHLILTLTNNWTPNGGMDQYVTWAGDQYHDQFYTDPKIRVWYEAWVSHLLNHVNPYTGKAYKDDPAIMVWELANEPRCQGTGPIPTSSSCTTNTLATWIANESAYIKTIDTNHLVAVGDEGYFCVPGSTDPYNGCGSGDDAVAFANVPDIDLVGLHIYTQASGSDPNYGTEYINQHIALGNSLGKPTYVGEYGLTEGDTRNAIYHAWQEDVLGQPTAGGMLVWSLSGGEPGALAAESEQSLGLSDQAPLLGTIRNAAQEAAAGHDLVFAPVADDQWTTTTLNTPIALNPYQNIVSYGGATINPASINLNPGKFPKSSTHVYGGTFSASGSSVLFTPDNNFNGQSVAPYNVADSNKNISNTAYLVATVTPTPAVAWELESFETGADGWSATGDTTSQSPLHATDGPNSLKVVATQTGWFGVQFPSSLNLSGRPQLSIDVYNAGVASSFDIVLQTGSGYTWCQSPSWPWLTAGVETTISVPLTPAGLGCSNLDLTDVEAMYVWIVAGNTYYLDNVRVAAVPTNQLPIEIASFENGTDGWSGPGTVSQENLYYTDGSYGLQINSTGGWFGAGNLGGSTGLDLSSKSGIAFDIDTPGNGTSVNMYLDWGSNNILCYGDNWGWADSSNSTQVIPFASVTTEYYPSYTTSCAPDLTQIHGVWLYFGSGTYYIDNVRAQ